MRAILIDPLARAVTEVQVDPKDTLASLYRIMGCQTVSVVSATQCLDLWVDDEGRFVPNNGAFKINLGRLAAFPDFVGPAVLIHQNPGSDGPEMSPLAPQITIESISKSVTWLSKGQPPRMHVVTFDGEACGGTWDGFTVGSDADPGL